MRRALFAALAIGALWAPLPTLAQAGVPATVEVEPGVLRLEVGGQATLKAVVKDASGNVVDAEVLFFSPSRRDLRVDTRTGTVEAVRPGEFEVIALVPRGQTLSLRNLEDQVAARVPVVVEGPAAARVRFEDPPARFYAGTFVDLRASAHDAQGNELDDLVPVFTSSDPDVISVDARGTLHLRRAGTAKVTVTMGRISSDLEVTVVADPVADFRLEASAHSARTGDVVQLVAVAEDAEGRVIPDVPIHFAVSGETDPRIIGAGAVALVAEDGRFVAERSGSYTIVAYTGAHTATARIDIEPRNVARDIEVVGHGAVRDRHTSDLWVWEGVDGRDYAVTGTWGADGHAYFWDVTDPRRMQKISEIQVDARTVNDVKVSADGRIAVISREGSSNRRDGLVIIDVTDPSRPQILSRFDENLTGGVHNLFIYEEHVYALSAGQRYDVISIEDPRNPRRVGSFELETPGHSIHDVWVVDGIAYSSNWGDGVVAVDVGGGGHGGSPNNPVMLGKYAYPSGANHAAFPFRSRSTGKLYAIAGDEILPFGLNTSGGGRPTYARGWIHFIEWDDWGSPIEVARYEVPEAGTHNLWVDEEEEILYVAYYNGGLRVVDISGELLGDLYRQGREIASFLPTDPQGYVANAPMAWGPQPHKGTIFLSDWNSGLWALRLTDRPGRAIGEPRD